MYRDEFKSRYTTIPLATFSRQNSCDTFTEDRTTFPHMHREMELLAIVEGTARFYIDSQVYDVQKGDVLIISPFVLHNATIFAGKEFSHYCLCFDLKMIPDHKLCEDLTQKRKRVSYLLRDGDAAKSVYAYIEKIFHIHFEQKKGWELQVTGWLSIILGLLCEYACIFDVYKNGADDINCRIMEYIECNYDKNISSAEVAKALYISKSYFCRVFKKNFGCHFHEYLCLYRMEKAKILLKTTDKTIEEIAMAIGFSSFSYFSKMFKGQLQMSPSEYRRSWLLSGDQPNV